MPQNSNVTPTLVSLLLCDQVIDDRYSNKKSAIGLFNTIVVPSTPTRVAAMAVLASLTEISGRCPTQLRLVRDADNAAILNMQGVVEAPDPLIVVDLVFKMIGIHIPTPGQYAFELLCGDVLLGRRRFHVAVGRPKNPPGSEGTPPATS